MKKIILVLLTATISIFYFACKKKIELDLTSISATDINAIPVSSPDPTDWKLNDVFTADENNLFGSTTAKQNCTSSTIDKIFAYPNPNAGIINIGNTLDSAQTMEVRIVDKNLKLLKSITNNGNNSNLIMDISSLVANGDFVRVYYKFINANCEYRGHGDIKIVK